MSQSKMPSATYRGGRGRSQPYAIGNPAKSTVASRSKPSAVPMALGLAPSAKKPSAPGQSTTCIAYAFQPAHGQEAILLIPTSALKFELREQAGQKVLQFLPPSAAFLPLLKATPVPSAAAATRSQPEQHGATQTTHPKPPQQTSSASSLPSATKDKSSMCPAAASDVAAVVEPTFRFQERPASWNDALRLDYGGKIHSGKVCTAPEPYTGVGFINKMVPVNAFPGQEEVDDEKRKAYVRYRSNNKLINRILDDRAVGYDSTWTESTSRRERISSLASKVRAAVADVERTEIRLDQKMAEVAEASDLFRYKMVRFQQLAALISSHEFHQATVEAELQQLMQDLDFGGSTCAF
ncbi:hypothetical protein HPB52_006729 [Rhipicephalus sanguineus]|uniref:Uncharacterized protein n=1 Tax=Rhipicephalus sanguineus TaxID=34632 RepID=A0A9D4PJM3_RHISA|nr:hypothetical protein HPB52_006729 [Rhipicephalus sanguineus]